ncbi:RidA family protein [Amycolatopsis palatopharyngis]|uniref:RidA family protein n=1 Tax=Amycolatopsis palatopharyngis TaxID=187982 RepID=UPI000E23E6F5|nr:Rid family detoxifying hydrolase [Amycolatopsis palatopharyngis]
MTKKAVYTDKAPTPVASYSQAVRQGNMLFLAGQGGIDVTFGKLVSDSIEEQTRQTLRNIGCVLDAAGARWDDVVLVRVFVTEHGEFEGMNSVYGEFFREPYPARTTVFCRLAPGMKVEIDAIAIIGSES